MIIHRPRTKYNDVEKVNIGCVKQRKHNKGQTKKMLRRLLALLEKILKELRNIERMEGGDNALTDKEKKLIDAITKVSASKTFTLKAWTPARAFLTG